MENPNSVSHLCQLNEDEYLQHRNSHVYMDVGVLRVMRPVDDHFDDCTNAFSTVSCCLSIYIIYIATASAQSFDACAIIHATLLIEMVVSV